LTCHVLESRLADRIDLMCDTKPILSSQALRASNENDLQICTATDWRALERAPAYLWPRCISVTYFPTLKQTTVAFDSFDIFVFGSTVLWFCSSVFLRLCSSAIVQFCNCAVLRLCDCAIVQLCDCAVLRFRYSRIHLKNR